MRAITRHRRPVDLSSVGAFLCVLFCFGSEAAHHEDVTCFDNEQNCYVSDDKIWPVQQCKEGCWLASTIELLQCKHGYQDENYWEREVTDITSVNSDWNDCPPKPPTHPGLFCYCEPDCPQGIKSLLETLGDITAEGEIYQDPLDPVGCSITKSNYPSLSKIMEWIRDKRAFAASVRNLGCQSCAHVVVVYGYDFSGTKKNLLYFDSREKPRYARKFLEYVEWQSGSGVISNALVPHYALPVPVTAHFDIQSGPSEFSYPGGSSATYTCTYFDGGYPRAHAYSFDWRLEFDHDGGTYVMDAATGLTGNDESTWTASIGALPTGYTWNLDSESRIMGRVVAQTVDSDGCGHTDRWDVRYEVPLPDIPQLVAPSDGAVGVGTDASVQWQAATGATSYWVELRKSPTSGTVEVDAPGLTGTTYSPSSLEPGTYYYWRVGATNEWATVWSGMWEFATSQHVHYVESFEYHPQQGGISLPEQWGFTSVANWTIPREDDGSATYPYASSFLQSTSPGGWGAMSNCVTPPFSVDRTGGSPVEIEFSLRFPTEYGRSWRENNKVWVGLMNNTNGSPALRYRLLFKPNRPQDQYTSYDLRLSRHDGQTETVLQDAWSHTVTPHGVTGAWVNFRLLLHPSGTIEVYYDNGSGVMAQYINALDTSYDTFTHLQFEYKTGTIADESNYHVLVDNISVSVLD